MEPKLFSVDTLIVIPDMANKFENNWNFEYSSTLGALKVLAARYRHQRPYYDVNSVKTFAFISAIQFSSLLCNLR